MKDSLVLYTKYAKHMNKLSMEQRGVLFTAIMNCMQDEEIIPEMDAVTDMIYGIIIEDIKKCNEAYEEKKAARSEAGKKAVQKRWENKKENTKENDNVPNDTNVYERMPPNTDHTNNVNVNVNDNVNANTNIVQEQADESLFLYLWDKYPNKKGKAQVSRKAKRALLAVGADEMERAIDRYVSELAKDSWRKPQNGSTFFNSGYVDYLDANYEPSKQKTGNAFLDLLQEGGNDTG